MDKSKIKPISALVLRVLGLLVGISGIVYHMLLNQINDTGFMVKHNLAYFTLQTNIFSVCIFLVLIIKTISSYCKTRKLTIASINPSFHLACTFYITITMCVYWLILAPLTGVPKNPVMLIDTLLLHTITPLIAIIDFGLFLEHGRVEYKSVFKWLSYPVLYLISVIIIAQFITEPYYTYTMGGKTVELMYPYPFLDTNVVGIPGFIGIVIALAILFLLFGTLYIYIDKKLCRNNQ